MSNISAHEKRKVRLLELNEVLLRYSDKVYDLWKNSENKKVKDYFLEVLFVLNRILYELDIDIQSKIYTYEMVKECEKMLELLKEIFDKEKE